MADLTLMVVHAHPDDESNSTGGTLARYSAEGVRTVLVTCTNGEFGDAPGHIKPGEEGHDPDDVARIRLGELKVATEALGVSHTELLGYRDSGMKDWPQNEDPRAFHRQPDDVVAARLIELFEQFRPQVVVTYFANSGYNHPDHLKAHDVTVAALDACDIPSKLYLIARTRAYRGRMREIAEEYGIELPQFLQPQPPAPPTPDGGEPVPEAPPRPFGVDDSLITTLSTGAGTPSRSAPRWPRTPANSRGRSSCSSPGRRSPRRSDPSRSSASATPPGAPLPEDDLFAGLR